MNPTRNTARTPMALRGTKMGGIGTQSGPVLSIDFQSVQRCFRRILPLKERSTTSDVA
jgi:hypothetical protein